MELYLFYNVIQILYLQTYRRCRPASPGVVDDAIGRGD